MPPSDRLDRRNAWLDLIRGLAALEVVAGHLYSFMFSGADAGSSPSWKAATVVAAQGHKAVIVFFVLSGYLIGKHVSERFGRDRWSWTDYAVRRLTRLWIVLVPALVLTAVLDAAGRDVLDGSLYGGLLDPGAYGRSLPDAQAAAANHAASTFLGNLLFLQNGILVPAYGVNGPLWSLANEFWYYVLFPLAFCAVRSRASARRRWCCGGLAVAFGAALPSHVLAYGLIWLLGYLVSVGEPWRDRLVAGRARAVAAVATGAVFLSSLYLVPRYGNLPEYGSDVATAILFALVLLLASGSAMAGGLVATWSVALADMSYTLYLTHFPFLALVLCALSGNRKSDPGVGAILLYAVLLALSVAYAFAIHWLFERHTGRVQSAMLRLVAGR